MRSMDCSATRRSHYEKAGFISHERRALKRGAVLLILMGLFLSWGAWAEEGVATKQGDDPSVLLQDQLANLPTGPEAVAAVMSGLTKRLTLSDEQQVKIEPMVKEMVSSMEVLRDRFKAGELKPMALGMQLQMTEKKASMKIDPVLDEQQRLDYAAMRQEQRRKMMQEMQKRAASGL
ncbi:MAG: hypothetical protein CL917_14010 [Deltaproteobacteria bacterium]|nr:hypothetical protein [Deltaproteobacteria bacterium]